MTGCNPMTPAQLKRARAQLGISAETLARTVGVSSGRVVRKWEAKNGTVPPYAALIVRILCEDETWRRHLLPQERSRD